MTYFKILTRDDNHSLSIKEKLILALVKAGHRESHTEANIIFFIGGDGTFLRAVQDHVDLLNDVIFVGIHTGTLGFFCEYSDQEINMIVQDIPSLKERAKSYRLIELTLGRKENLRHVYAVNEVRVENPFLTLVTDVEIDQHPLETFRGSGLIVSSTLGSSAYNKSLGGSLIDVQLETLQLTEMATIQNNAYRSLGSSLVLSDNKVITFKGNFDKAIVGYDSNAIHLDSEVHEVRVCLSDKTVRLVHQIRKNYYQTLKQTFVKNK
jgi:NAD+ kinase